MRILRHIIALLALIAVPLNAQILNTQRVSQLPVSNVWSAGDYIMFQRTSPTGQISVITEAQRFSSNLLYLSGGLLTTGQVATIASNSAYGLRTILVYTNSGRSFSATNLNAITYVINTNLSAQVLTNANSTFYQLLSGNSIKTISSDGTVTITPTSSNLILGAIGGGGTTVSNANTSGAPLFTNSSVKRLTSSDTSITITDNGLSVDLTTGTNSGISSATASNIVSLINSNINRLVTNGVSPAGLVNTPRKILFDEDFNSDADDVGGLYTLHWLQDNGLAEIVGATTVVQTTNAIRAVHAVNVSVGRPYIQLGQNTNSTIVANEFGWAGILSTNWLPGHSAVRPTITNSVALWRTVLANNPTGTVTIVIGGQMKNLYDVFNSTADAISSDNGSNILRRAARFVIVGGNYPAGNEYNFYTDPTSAVVLNSMTNFPIDWVSFESGNGILTGQESQYLAEDHPLRIAYNNLVASNTVTWTSGRQSWGAIAALWAGGVTNNLRIITNGYQFVGTSGTNLFVRGPASTQRQIYPANTNQLQAMITSVQSTPKFTSVGAPSRLQLKDVSGTHSTLLGTEGFSGDLSANSTVGDAVLRPSAGKSTIITAGNGVPIVRVDNNGQFGVSTRYKLQDIAGVDRWVLTYDAGTITGQTTNDLADRMESAGGDRYFSTGTGGVPNFVLRNSGNAEFPTGELRTFSNRSTNGITLGAGTTPTLTPSGTNVVITGGFALATIPGTGNELHIGSSGLLARTNITGGGASNGFTGIEVTNAIFGTLQTTTSQYMTNRALIVGAGDSEQALYYAVDSTATMSPLNFPYWLTSMPTWAGRFDYVPMAIPGQTLVQISNNLSTIYVPLLRSATNRVRLAFLQGGYNDKALGATDAEVTNTLAGMSAVVRAEGAKAVLFDVVGYKTTANAISNLVVAGLADHFVPFAGAESHLMADAIHLKPFGSLLWARSLTNTIQLAVSPEPSRIGEVSFAATNITAPLVTTKGINFSSFSHIPPPTSSNATNLIRPYVEAFEGGIWAWNTNQYDFGGYRTYFGKSFVESVQFGLGRDAGGFPFASQTPGTNWLFARLVNSGNGFGVVDTSGIVKFGVTGDGNIPMRGTPIFYGTQNYTDSSSNNVGQFGRGTTVGTFAKSEASWGYRIVGTTNNWFVARSSDGGIGLSVDGSSGAVTANGTLYADLMAPTNFSGSYVYLDSGGVGNSYAGLDMRTNGVTSGRLYQSFVASGAANPWDIVINNLVSTGAVRFMFGTNPAATVKIETNSITLADGTVLGAGGGSSNFNVASFNNITVSNTATISNITASSVTTTNLKLASASTQGYVLAVQGDGVTLAPGASVVATNYAITFATLNAQTNSTANTNLTLNFTMATQDIYLTNNASFTNITGLTLGTNANLTIRITPVSVNRSLVWPTLGGNSFGARFLTNNNSPIWTTITNSVVVSMSAWGTNVHISMSEWK